VRSLLKTCAAVALLCVPTLAAAPAAPGVRASAADVVREFGSIDKPLGWVLEVQMPDRRTMRIDSRTSDLSVFSIGGGTAAAWAWSPNDDALADLCVRVEFNPAGWAWWLEVQNAGKSVALRQLTFPVIDLPLTDADSVIVPAISGRLHGKPLSKRLQARGDYPGGWLTMQCAGLYGPKGGTYVGVHDPYASTKRLEMDTKDGYLALKWTWPAPDCGKPGNAWEMPGKVVIRPFDGDWYDFAQIYRDWASKEAKWWPRGSQVGRPDTPNWMKDISVWALASGTAKSVVNQNTKLHN